MRNSYAPIFTITAACCAVFAIAGCELPEQLPQPLQSAVPLRLGKMKMNLKADAAPPEIAHALITVDQISLRRTDGQFLIVSETPIDLDILSLASNPGPVLFRSQLPEGRYDHVRFRTTGEGIIVFTDGSQYPLIVPSGDTSGIKMFFDSPLEVLYGRILKAAITVDLSQSFHPVGGLNWKSDGTNEGVIFHPVIRTRAIVFEDHNPDGATEEPGAPCSDSTSDSGSADNDAPDTSPDPNPYDEAILGI